MGRGDVGDVTEQVLHPLTEMRLRATAPSAQWQGRVDHRPRCHENVPDDHARGSARMAQATALQISFGRGRVGLQSWVAVDTQCR